MNCRQCRSSLVDVALGMRAAAEVDAHLAACPHCRAAVEESRSLLGRIDSEIRATLAVTPPPGLFAGVRQGVADRGKPKGYAQRHWLVPATAAAVVVLLGVSIVNQRTHPSRIAPPRALPEALAPSMAARVETSLPAPPVKAVARSVQGAHPAGPVEGPAAPSLRTMPETLVPRDSEVLFHRLAVALRHDSVEPGSFLATDFRLARPTAAVAELPIVTVRSYPPESDEPGISYPASPPPLTQIHEWRSPI